MTSVSSKAPGSALQLQGLPTLKQARAHDEKNASKGVTNTILQAQLHAGILIMVQQIVLLIDDGGLPRAVPFL